jgi:hypothetical protein
VLFVVVSVYCCHVNRSELRRLKNLGTVCIKKGTRQGQL